VLVGLVDGGVADQQIDRIVAGTIGLDHGSEHADAVRSGGEGLEKTESHHRLAGHPFGAGDIHTGGHTPSIETLPRSEPRLSGTAGAVREGAGDLRDLLGRRSRPEPAAVAPGRRWCPRTRSGLGPSWCSYDMAMLRTALRPRFMGLLALMIVATIVCGLLASWQWDRAHRALRAEEGAP